MTNDQGHHGKSEFSFFQNAPWVMRSIVVFLGSLSLGKESSNIKGSLVVPPVVQLIMEMLGSKGGARTA